jgi:positive regulator of sigma E activity
MCQPQGTARYVEADNRLDARVGDDVCIEIPTIQSMIAMVLVFGVPVVLALIGLILGAFFGNVPSMLLGAIGFVAGLVIAKIINDVFARTYFLPRVVEIARQAKDLTL